MEKSSPSIILILLSTACAGGVLSATYRRCPLSGLSATTPGRSTANSAKAPEAEKNSAAAAKVDCRVPIFIQRAPATECRALKRVGQIRAHRERLIGDDPVKRRIRQS